MSSRSTDAVYEQYLASPPEVYERHFVPSIGMTSAAPVLEAARLCPGERVLDLACGTGLVARLAAEKVGPSGSVTGTDIHPAMVEVARATSPAAPEVEWHVAPAEDLPLPDASFDAVLCSLALQFFPDKVAALEEVRRVLAPGGRVAIGTPGPIPPLMADLHEVIDRHLGAEAAGFVHAVFTLHDPAEVEKLLTAAGFAEVEAEHRALPVRLDGPANFLWQYLQGTPLAMAVAEIDHDARMALQMETVERWQPYVDGDGMAMDPGLVVATARRVGKS